MGRNDEKRSVSYSEIEALPPNLVGEIVDDTLYASPRPAPRHAMASSGLGAAIGGPFCFDPRGPGGWWILDEPELHLGANVLVPDVAGWRRERMASMPETAYFTLAPDWVCEVISPSTGALDRIRKLPAYARAGVSHAWILDPLEQTLEVFRLVSERWTLVQGWEGNERVRAEPFEEIELDLSRLWGRTE